MLKQYKAAWIASLLVILVHSPYLYASEKQDFSTIVEKTGPSVVNVIAIPVYDENKLVPDELRGQLEGTPLMDMLRQMYGDKLEEKLSGKGTNIGSGCIVSEDGYIVTNNHVVEGAKSVYVVMLDRRQFEADVIGSDPGTDLALLHIKAKDLPFMALNEGVIPKVGEWVLAIGTPFGFENSVSVGVVSAIGRNLGSSERYVSFIQTDAAVNPGNSGGPLLNDKGELLGINSQIVSESGDYAGLSFAVPVRTVKYVIDELKKKGSVERGWMGIAFQDVDANLANAFGLSKLKGALVSKVFPSSPAYRSGLQIGDIIQEVNGCEIIRSTDIPPIVGLLPVGTELKIKVLRDKQEKEVALLLEQYVPAQVAVAHDEKAMIHDSLQAIQTGITVRDLEAFENKSEGADHTGVYVVAVESQPWVIAGVLRGDRILRVDNSSIKHPTEFYQAIKEGLAKGMKNIPVLIARDGEIQHYVVVKFDK